MPFQERVVIGVDPHKLSATIEVVDEREHLLARGGSRPTGWLRRDGEVREGVAAADLGGGGVQRCRPAVGAAAVGRRRAGGGCAGQAGRSGPVVRHV